MGNNAVYINFVYVMVWIVGLAHQLPGWFCSLLPTSSKSMPSIEELSVGTTLANCFLRGVRDMQNFYEQDPAYKLSCSSDLTVLITGPTGVGKSWLAERIHQNSPRAHKPFITVNLAALHEGTLESELFGHERGAFTGADKKRVGWLELADGGTVFLDEIGELPTRLQARLLEFLQSRTLSPVGGSQARKVDVRVIAATNRELECAVKNGLFREDLYHRLRVVELCLKPLRDRADEFDSLVHNFIQSECKKINRSVLRISKEVAEDIERYDWPGNVRELQNAFAYAVRACDGTELRREHLPPWLQAGSAKALVPGLKIGEDSFGIREDYHGVMSDFERCYLREMLKRNRGRINQTARRIGLNKSTLIRRLRAYTLPAAQP